MGLSGDDLGVVRGLVLVVLIIGFIGVWAWAWSKKRTKTFHDASLLPLEDDNGRVPIRRRDAGTEE